jgi:hypothetical protein
MPDPAHGLYLRNGSTPTAIQDASSTTSVRTGVPQPSQPTPLPQTPGTQLVPPVPFGGRNIPDTGKASLQGLGVSMDEYGAMIGVGGATLAVIILAVVAMIVIALVVL